MHDFVPGGEWDGFSGAAAVVLISPLLLFPDEFEKWNNWVIKVFMESKKCIDLQYKFSCKKKRGPTEIRTRVVGFKVQSDSHYTIGP